MLKKTVFVLRIALAQINSTVGDIKGNADKIIYFTEKAKSLGADLVVFPEFSLIGCPVHDLLRCKGFLKETEQAIRKILPYTIQITSILGSVYEKGASLFNAAYVLSNGDIATLYFKRKLKELPHINERKYFTSGEKACVLNFSGASIELVMGDEAKEETLRDSMSFYIVMDSAFYQVGKIERNIKDLNKIFSERAYGYVNMTGGQDEWIFYGGSFISKRGKTVCQGPLFEEDLIITDIKVDHGFMPADAVKLKINPFNRPELEKKKEEGFYPLEEEILRALITSTRDYVKKNGFKRVFLGLSGGLDSAVTAYIASRALGSENVTCIFMPTKYTSKESLEDAIEVAKNLRIRFIKIPIDQLFTSYMELFEEHFDGEIREITAENIQPRIRANILMAFSNNFDGIVLVTGNKSEIFTGYCTLYGDTAGGFAVLKDVPKTFVYRVAHHINRKEGFMVIPKRILEKPPSAELKYNQKDSDTLPPYEVLDEIIAEYTEMGEETFKENVRKFDRFILKETLNRFFKNEYKRRQSAIGPNIFSKSVENELRFPVTNLWRYKDETS
ncbi:MAG: NAD+ synthase [Deltaproteobacteria bacterium]|nr:NAD+ synthase [Deltaproteobacteria bacterium]